MDDQSADRKSRRELKEAEFEKAHAKFNKRRDEDYRLYCETYARRKKLKVHIEDGCSYLDTKYGAILLCKPTDPEYLWLQTYWALKEVAPPQKG
jgi:hypothetical protein